MLDSIWQLLRNNGLDTDDIANSIHSLFYKVPAVTDAEGAVIEPEHYDGTLRALAGFPVLGTLLELLAGFAPAVDPTTLA